MRNCYGPPDEHVNLTKPNGRISDGMANVSRFRQAAIEHLDRTAPAVRAAVAGTWEKTRPVIEHATAAVRKRLHRVLGDYRQREDQRRAEERRQAEVGAAIARTAGEQSLGSGMGM
ncbi:hypothetical protein AruPA_21275 [Acidiphilium sp. PA]|uniref:hypothetical protein n=1 Tax=Acidiphilium sp. PA TaxID=2871705 RepID=UPI002243D7C5|nr:hypothetical protein [Acidiphilium sp. PA]MCW8309546.1 hypothetical protein [Acidiphilium sp. PA]